ncbi:hypothetical protein GcM1_106004 [Golovinomyces cichoracearum]|uniref:Uncharacterized protein n=1 Tax=Golovinomyces cichoracearum TaxID=62708 RepID=A0A420JC13_9PEZI|nr:hypothetical protein GcM1_106004 [Golovinomyces cichoracearum]
MNIKTPDETTIIKYLSTAAISSAAVSLIDSDTIAKASIDNFGQATAAQLNTYAPLRIMDYKTNQSTYSDLNLLYAFKEDFEQWTTSEFKELDSRIRRELRQAVRYGGIYTGRGGGRYEAQLSNILTLESLPP